MLRIVLVSLALAFSSLGLAASATAAPTGALSLATKSELANQSGIEQVGSRRSYYCHWHRKCGYKWTCWHRNGRKYCARKWRCWNVCHKHYYRRYYAPSYYYYQRPYRRYYRRPGISIQLNF